MNGVKVFLDDERATPKGWVRTYWPEEVIALMETASVAEISLDHDLATTSTERAARCCCGLKSRSRCITGLARQN